MLHCCTKDKDFLLQSNSKTYKIFSFIVYTDNLCIHLPHILSVELSTLFRGNGILVFAKDVWRPWPEEHIGPEGGIPSDVVLWSTVPDWLEHLSCNMESTGSKAVTLTNALVS